MCFFYKVNGTIIKYSDFHFFGEFIRSDYHVYLLADEEYTTPEKQLSSIWIGRCKANLPPGNAVQGVDSMLNATEEELDEWLSANEESDESDKLCDPVAKLARRIMSIREWGPPAYSNYSLFEMGPIQTTSDGVEDIYLYMRGESQRPNRSEAFSTVDKLLNVKELHDVWLVATNWGVNFSAPPTELSGAKSFDADDVDQSCPMDKGILPGPTIKSIERITATIMPIVK